MGRTDMRAALGVCAVAALSLIGACAEDTTTPTGNGGKTDEVTGVQAALADRNDPIANWLRDESGVTPEGEFNGDYGTILEGINAIQGCAPEELRTYIISDGLVTEGEPFPRVIGTACANDTAKASAAFLSTIASTEDGDVDLRDVEMFAWDSSARLFRFYKIKPVGEGSKVQLTVDPGECADCHTGPEGMDRSFLPMAPIMNELTKPWPHWNSGADSFDFRLPEDVKERDNYLRVTDSWKGSAQDLEVLVREGIESKVNVARLRARRDRPADVNKAMALIRPLFCSERVNYATEDGNTLTTNAWVDDGVRNMLARIATSDAMFEPTWDWYHDGTLRLPDGDTPVDMVTVRGHADVDYETRLVSSSGGLSPEQVLRILALDWKTPVMSDFRCSLWTSALERMTISPPEVNPDDRTMALWPMLYDEIMQVRATDGEMVALTPPEGSAVIAVDLVEDGGTALADAVQAGLGDSCTDAAGICALSAPGFGDIIDTYLTSAAAAADVRETLKTVRDTRACRVFSDYPNQPEILDVEGCQ